uniref:Death domain-containing protein n=1 Tax=Branchiostoma floridae TaxID=7739 RepID=C3ZU47_BRAFL|eukprot:XP_002587922.1 hypothetical protein BRAFLDRAFT_87310 [Branchiostoma floridae]
MAGPVRERVTDADRRHFDFVQTLLRISDELTEEETANVKLFCLHLIPEGQSEQLKRAVDVFQKLIKLDKIDQENLDFLKELLERIGRQDLIRDVLQQFQPPDREIPENPELQPGSSQQGQGAIAEGHATSNTYVVVNGQVRMIQETLDRLRNHIATLSGSRRSQVKFRGYKKHKSILVHFSIPQENTAVLRHMADHSDPRLVYMGVKSLQIDAEVPIKVKQGAPVYDVKRQHPVDDIEVGCSTRTRHQRAPQGWTRLSALNLFSDALPLHLQAAASLEYQGFSYSLVRALVQKDRLREHQMRQAIQNLRNAEVDSNKLLQKAEMDSNTIMTLSSKLNITENRLKEALETIAVLEEKLQQAQEYAEKAAKQVASQLTEYRGEKPPGGWPQEYMGEKPPGGWSALVEKADAVTQTHIADTVGTTGRPEDLGDKLGEDPTVKQEEKRTARQDSDTDNGVDERDDIFSTKPIEEEQHIAVIEGAPIGSTGDIKQGVVSFGGEGSVPGKFSYPRGVVVSPSNEIFVAEKDNKRVQANSTEGVYLRHFPTVVPGTGDKVMEPHDVCMDGNGTLWVVGGGKIADHVVQYSTGGTAMAGIELKKGSYDRGIAVNMRTNHILVTDCDQGEFHVFRPDGSLVRTVRHPQAGLKRPGYVTVDGEGNILVSDWGRKSVSLYDESGKFLFWFGGEGGGEELTEEETAVMKLSCMHLIPKGRAEQLKRTVDVFHKLMELDKIDQENLEFIEEILERIGRQDLIRDVLRSFQPPDREIPENPELQPENPELQPENPEHQPGASLLRTTAEGDVQGYFDDVIEEVSYKWDDLAWKLGFQDNEIKVIRDLERDHDHRCREMLTRWRNREGKGATPQVLKQALKNIGETRTAESLEGTTTSNTYVVVHGTVRMIQETLDHLKNCLATLIGTRRSQVKFRGYKKHKSILVLFSIPRENTAVLRHMADHSDPRLVYMGVKSLQIDAEVPIKVQQGAPLYDFKRQLPVDDIEVGCSTRTKHQRAPQGWTRLSALNLFSDALPLHLQAAASLEYQGFSYSLVRALVQKDRLREHQMRQAIQNLRNAEVDSNTLRQKAEVDSNTIMTLRSKLNITENRLKEALETIAVLEEKLKQAQEYAEKAAKQVASHVTEYRGEKPPGGWFAHQAEKADVATQTHIEGSVDITRRPGERVEKHREDPTAKEEGRKTPRKDSGSGRHGKDAVFGSEAFKSERHTELIEGAAPGPTGVVTFGGKGSEPGKFNYPRGVVVSPSNEIFVADTDNRRVQVHSTEGVYLRHFPTVVPSKGGYYMGPHDVCMDGSGTLWVVGQGETAHYVVQYSTDGTAMAGFDLEKIGYSRRIAVGMRTNHILVTDPDNAAVHVFRPDGSLVRTVRHPRGGEMTRPTYATVDGEGNILVSDWDTHCVYVYDEFGKFLFQFGVEGSGEGQLSAPCGICTDSSGHILVADYGNKSVQIFTRHGEFVRTVRTGFRPEGLAVGPEGQLVVNSYLNDIVTVYPSY